MKRTLKIVIICICSALLGGCFGGTEVNKRAFVQLMGIEKQSGVYMVSLQLYENGSSDGNPDISKPNSSSVSGSGSDLNSALSECELMAGKQLFLGHVKMVILGTGITDIGDALKALTEGGKSRGTVSISCPVAYSYSPSDITETFMEQGLFSADRLTDITDGYVRAGKCAYTTLASVIESTSMPFGAAALPVILSDGESISYSGIVAADNSGNICRISESDTSGYVILSGSFDDRGNMVVPLTDGVSSAEITSSSVCTNADITDGKLRINAKVKLKLNVSGEDKREIAEAVCENIRDSCISAYSETMWYNGCDVFGIYKLLRRDCPELAESKDIGEILKGSILNISVSADG
ncbi:MAG: Ger(x)C family spore germination C-terminal domain-containing protein [Oscillospiraceae bacterium]|nr:Ger(x)C family spore germination C-terminal domain-containing protein [Oscillospiraceae bacterium]